MKNINKWNDITFLLDTKKRVSEELHLLIETKENNPQLDMDILINIKRAELSHIENLIKVKK